MLSQFAYKKIALNVLIIIFNLLFIDYSKAFGVDFYLPWTNFESYIVSQGNGGAYSHQGRFYYAWDFAMPEGTLVRASAQGKVVKVVNSVPSYRAKSWGNYVVIEHSNGIYSRYAHLELASILVSTGTKINQGQIIGKSGNTGNSTGPHLHYQVENQEGVSIPSSFMEVGVPINSQMLISQNNSTVNINQNIKRINYEKLYVILSSDELKQSEDNPKTPNQSPSQAYITYTLNKTVNSSDSYFSNYVQVIKDIFFQNISSIILSLFSINFPLLNILNINYYLFKLLVI